MKKIFVAALLIALCMTLFLAAGCGSQTGDSTPGSGTEETTGTETDTAVETGAGSDSGSKGSPEPTGGLPAWAPDPQADPPPSLQPWAREAQDKSKTLADLTENTIQATITMEDGGEIVLELYPDLAPQAVRNFVYLARLGFYDGLKFHRIMAGFMIQGGCPDSTGSGNPGYSIWGEFALNGFKNELAHKPGIVSMARSQNPYYNSAGSQFFIVHGRADFLDGEYAAFGAVISGMDVVDKIAGTPNSGDNGKVAPENMPVIKSIVIDDDIELPEPEKIPRAAR